MVVDEGTHEGHRSAALLLAVVAAVVAGKNLWIGIAPDWPDVGPDGSAGSVVRLVIRNAVLALPVVAMAMWWRRDGHRSPRRTPGRAVWRFGPAVVVIVVAAIAAPWRPLEFPGARLIGVVVGTALLEELIFRGAMLDMSDQVRSRVIGRLVPGVAFGLWHLIDAINDVGEHPSWGGLRSAVWIVGTVVAMALVSWCVFEPFRRRDGTIVGPWLLHAAVNGSMIVLGFGGA